MLLGHGADVNAADGHGYTALEIACAAEHENSFTKETVDTLLKAGADINTPVGYWFGPLEAATVRGHLDVVMLLLERGVRSAVQKDSAQQVAIYLGFTEIVLQLLNSGANVQAARGRGEYGCERGTPLHMATFEGYDRIFDMLELKPTHTDSLEHRTRLRL